MSKSFDYKDNEKSFENSTLPILYSLRNCPFAMRARIAIFKAQQTVLLRDLVLTDKPLAMLQASPKGTVPVIVLANGTVIEESLDIMLWALQETDPSDLLHANHLDKSSISDMHCVIKDFDHGFKRCLEQYKCAKRYQEPSLIEFRQACEVYIQQLELRLAQQRFLISNQESLADIALLPYIRQFARIERQWYLESPYPYVRRWLNHYLQSPMFTKVMAKYPLWLTNYDEVLFGGYNK